MEIWTLCEVLFQSIAEHASCLVPANKKVPRATDEPAVKTQ